MPARNTLVQLLAVYTNPKSHNAQRHRQTDGQQAAANSRSYCVAVRSANKTFISFTFKHVLCMICDINMLNKTCENKRFNLHNIQHQFYFKRSVK